jgi:hypothetical protein
MTLLVPGLAGIDLANLTTADTKVSFSLQRLVVDEALQRGVPGGWYTRYAHAS